MDFEILIDRFWEVAKQNPDGFTHSLSNVAPKTGYVVAFEATQNSFGREGLKHCLNHAMLHEGLVGGWLNTDNGLYYFDSVLVFQNLNEALNFGKVQNQIAIFDIQNCEVIRL